MKKHVPLIIAAIFTLIAAVDLYASYAAPLIENRGKAWHEFIVALGFAVVLFKLDDINGEIKKLKK